MTERDLQELQRLRDEVAALRRTNVELRRERDEYVRQIVRMEAEREREAARVD